jgi:predicted SAM-dependent methyltransferase
MPHTTYSSDTPLTSRLKQGEFEFGLNFFQMAFYHFERLLGHILFRRRPPHQSGPKLLNLGCGPHFYKDWINADDYSFKRRFREKNFKPNWNLDITRNWKCVNDYWDGIFTEHVIEHVLYSEAVRVFEECYRTLKPGAWLRVSVPDVAKYVSAYQGEQSAEAINSFPSPALALSFVTQMHLHRSAWNTQLMTQILFEIGFVDVTSTSFGCGVDENLIRDDPNKAPESLYVEARKPVNRIL